MSKSFKKVPISGNTTAPSEKKDKQLANRKLRRINKKFLNNIECPDIVADRLSTLKDESNIWDFAKDGKKWFKNLKHVDKPIFNKLMRK